MVLLGDGDDAVHHHDYQNDYAVQPVLPSAGRQGQGGGGQKNQDHGVLQLAQYPDEKGGRLRLGQLVGPHPLQTLGRFPVGQTLGPALQLPHHLVQPLAVPIPHTITPNSQFIPSIPPGLSAFW